MCYILRLLLVGIYICSVQCGYYFVTVPNVIRFDHDETVVVSVFDLYDAAVKVWLQHGEKKFSTKTVVVRDEATPISTIVKVTESDLFSTVVREKPRRLSVCSEYSGRPQCRDVFLSYKTGYLILQTDKPIYTPNQRVRVRTFALDESLKTVNGWEVAIEVISPSDKTVAREMLTNRPSGIYENEFQLPPFPETGQWTVRAFYGGRLETESRELFEVKEYILPTFGVTIDVDVPYILHDTDEIGVTVRAKYVFEKPVDGNARLTLNLKDENGVNEYILDVSRRQLEGGFEDTDGSVTKFRVTVAEILNSPLLRDRHFPAESRLEIIATVLESATGKEESTSHDTTFFTVNPYKFKFTRSKLNFRPGLEYSLKIDVMYVNGEPATQKNLLVKMFINGIVAKVKREITDSRGQASAVFTITTHTTKLAFTVITRDKRQESEKFEVQQYAGRNQIQTEQLIRDENMILQASSNITGTGYTGILFMVVTRGKVVLAKFKESSNSTSLEVTKEIQQLISPSARLLAFYVDKNTNVLVADSVKFDVQQKCRDKGLKIEAEKTQVRPGSYKKLTITGDPGMWVGLNMINMALLLLNNKNVLRKNKMFEALDSHDLGCGQGSGRNSADVFKKTGLTVLTNAVVSEDDLRRNSDDCSGTKRRRRDIRGIQFQSEYASDLDRLEAWGFRLHTRTDFRESGHFEVKMLNGNGEQTTFLNYPDSITKWMVQAMGITADKGICIAEPVYVTTLRDLFIQLDLPYKATRLKNFDVKATVFSYGLMQLQANIYFEADVNLCYSTESGKPSPRIKIELPPNSAKAVKFPMIPVKTGNTAIKVTAIHDIWSYAIEKKLNVMSIGIEEKITIQVCLDPNHQMEDCENDARVIRDVADEAGRVYTVDLTLPVESIVGTGYGVGYIQSYDNDKDATILLEGVDSLLRKPGGLSNQTILRLAQNVYAMMYLKETKQVTQDIEVKGNQWIREGVVREVSQNKHSDGSYAARQKPKSGTWLTAFVAKVLCQANRTVDGAVDEQKDILDTTKWLKNHINTEGEFVYQMPGQTDKRDPSLIAFVLITLLECNIKTEGLEDTIKTSVSFLEDLDKDMLRRKPYILALSTYALAMAKSAKKWEFKNLLHEIQHRNGKDIYWGRFERKPGNDAFETTAYALLAMMEFKDMRTSAHIVMWLTSQRHTRGSFQTTQEAVVGLQSLSTYISKTRTIGKGLNVKLLAQDWMPVHYELYRGNSGVYEIVRNLPVEHTDNMLIVKVTGGGEGRLTIDLRYNRPATAEETCPFDISDVEVDEITDYPINKDLFKELKCDVCGRCENNPQVNDNEWPNPSEADKKIDSNFGREKGLAGDRSQYFTSSGRCVRFSVSSRTEKKHSMSIINFGLETGAEVVKEDLDKLITENPNIARYETPSSGQGYVIFYLQEITTEETKFIFRLNDGFEGDVLSRQPASLTVYDYNNPDQSCTQFYGTGPSKGQRFSYECDKNQTECRCIQNQCSQPVHLERLKRPAMTLFRYTCNAEKADYAVIVEIESIIADYSAEQKIARGIVVKNIHQGIHDLSRDSIVHFFWSLNCDYPDLEIGGQYYIIGRDGIKFRTTYGEEEYRYPLMGITLIIRKPQKYGKLFSILKKYEQIMENACRV